MMLRQGSGWRISDDGDDSGLETAARFRLC